LPDDADGHGRRAVEPQGAALVFRTELYPGEILELDEDPAVVRHDEIGELFGRLELSERADREFAAFRLDATRRDLDVPRADRFLHLLASDAPRRQLGGREPHPHRKAPLPEDSSLPDSR